MTPTRSPQHLAFVRTLPCSVCGRTRGVQAAHAPGSRGMGQKRSDLETLPLCAAHHEEQHRIGWPRFTQTYGLDVQAILRELRERPRLLIMDGAALLALSSGGERRFGWKAHYVAHYKDQEFILKPVYFGLELSLTCAFRICGEYLRDQLMQRRAA